MNPILITYPYQYNTFDFGYFLGLLARKLNQKMSFDAQPQEWRGQWFKDVIKSRLSLVLRSDESCISWLSAGYNIYTCSSIDDMS